MSYIDVTGKTESEAIEKGLAQLSLDRDDVSLEILERAKSGFLGLGGSPAKVRLTYGPVEPEVPQQKPVQIKRPAPAAKPAPKPAPERLRQEPAAAEFVPVPVGEEVHDEKAEEIRAFLSGLLKQMETEAQVRVYQPENGRYQVLLEGGALGGLIGRRGETLDAIQQLTSYSVNRAGGRVRVQLDAENYRAKREQSLENLAKKVADKVVKYRRSVTLEPMNAYERHVIHTALQDYPGVTTGSIGVDPNRRVVVSCSK